MEWTRRTVFNEIVDVVAVGTGSGMCMAGFAGYGPRAVFPSLVVRPKMLDTLAGMDQRGSYAERLGCACRNGNGMCMAGIAGYDAFALCSL